MKVTKYKISPKIFGITTVALAALMLAGGPSEHVKAAPKKEDTIGYNQLGKQSGMHGGGVYYTDNSVGTKASLHGGAVKLIIDEARDWKIVVAPGWTGDIPLFYMTGQDNNNNFHSLTLHVDGEGGSFVIGNGTKSKENMQSLYIGNFTLDEFVEVPVEELTDPADEEPIDEIPADEIPVTPETYVRYVFDGNLPVQGGNNGTIRVTMADKVYDLKVNGQQKKTTKITKDGFTFVITVDDNNTIRKIVITSDTPFEKPEIRSLTSGTGNSQN